MHLQILEIFSAWKEKNKAIKDKILKEKYEPI